MLNWLNNQFGIFSFLDNNQFQFCYHQQECLVGAGCVAKLEAKAGNAFDQLKIFSDQHKDWLFGHLGYDLKNETEQLSSSHDSFIQFPDLFFFVPEIIIELKEGIINIGSFKKDHQQIFDSILKATFANEKSKSKAVQIESKISKEEYEKTIAALKRHILRGDCYEINFCQEFFANDVELDPVQTYQRLAEISPAPFAAFYKLDEKYLFSASPERYLQKSGNEILSQPIKGTSARNINDEQEDIFNKEKLFHSKKDRTENVMIVDLVRNDLSKVCVEGSVTADELFGIYTFPQVHQMISTIKGKLQPAINWVDIIRSTFPMGSMTGAPKKRVLELIEQYERSKRGLFSGAIGYVTPERDFDFNVVIRSIFYDELNKKLSYQVGSGITYYSHASMEYEECLLKAEGIKKVLAFDQYFSPSI